MVGQVQYCEWGNGQQDEKCFVASIEHIIDSMSYSGYKQEINREIESGRDE